MMEQEVEYKVTNKITTEVIQCVLKVEKTTGLTAENIIEEAKSKKSPLHTIFDWDNNEAAEKWRLHQARVFINEIKVVVNDKTMYAFENVSLKVDEIDSERVYKPVYEIINHEAYRKQIINQAMGRLLYWKEQYNNYSEFEQIFKSIEQVRKKLKYGKPTRKSKLTAA